MFRRFIASLLIFSQLTWSFPVSAQDVVAADVINALINIFASPGLTKAQKPAPEVASSQSDDWLNNGDRATTLFDPNEEPLRSHHLQLGSGVEVYDPNQKLRADQQKTRLNAVLKRIGKRRVISADEAATAVDALMPFIRYLEAQASASNAYTMTLQPGQTAEIVLNGYPVDMRALGWINDRRVRLAPVKSVVLSDAQDIYDALVKLSTSDQRYSTRTNLLVVNLLRTLTSMSSGYMPHSLRLTQAERAILDQAMPNGGDRYQRWVLTQADRIERFKARGIVAKPIGLGQKRPQYMNEKNYEYTLLDDNVAAKTTYLSDGTIGTLLTNKSNKPFVFTPSNYVAVPADGNSRIALVSGLNGFEDGTDGCYGPEWQAVQEAEKILKYAFDVMQDVAIDQIQDYALSKAATLGKSFKNPFVAAAFRSLPVLSNGIALLEAAYGRDLLTGEELSTSDRFYSLAGVVIPAEAILRKGGKILKLSGLPLSLHQAAP